jgi:two-component sensor histidine kinase
VSGVTIDITDLKEAEARHTLLIREIDHRARNVLAVAQSIIRLTRAKTIDDYVAKIEGRIKALSTAHGLLSESRWEGADLGKLLEEELAPYRNGNAKRFAADGPSVFLHPASAQSIALVLHELATNAAKYGAMSEQLGRVRVSWESRDDLLALTWEEADGPPVQVPTSEGHGMMVINASVVRQLGGTVSFDWRPTGLRFTMSARISSEDARSDSRRALDDARNSYEFRAPAAERAARLLLVEDEELVGMMLRDMLIGLGYSVIGPYTRIAEAMQAVSGESFHAAILDINVNGELVYDLADAIAARDIPFLFVTGYGAEAVVERFRHMPVLQKPIDRASLQRVLTANMLSKAQAAAARRFAGSELSGTSG